MWPGTKLLPPCQGLSSKIYISLIFLDHRAPWGTGECFRVFPQGRKKIQLCACNWVSEMPHMNSSLDPKLRKVVDIKQIKSLHLPCLHVSMFTSKHKLIWQQCVHQPISTPSARHTWIVGPHPTTWVLTVCWARQRWLPFSISQEWMEDSYLPSRTGGVGEEWCPCSFTCYLFCLLKTFSVRENAKWLSLLRDYHM